MRWIWILTLFIGCSGYRLTQQNNPLSQYGIHSLAVPMFYNYSNLPDVNVDFTRETFRLLTHYTGLKLHSGYSQRADAVLIGIIRSSDKLTETLRSGNFRVAKEYAPTAIGSRENFYIPGTTDINLELQIIVIKRPTEDELTLLRSGIGQQVKATSKIIFNETIKINKQYTREVLDGAGTQVIATQNAGVQRKAIQSMAEEAALSVRDIIFYAF